MNTVDVFAEAELAGMKLKNRIIRSATHEGLGDGDDLIQSHREIVDAVKPYRVPLIQQLAHGGAFSNSKATLLPAKAPSRMKNPMKGSVAAELTRDEIAGIIDGFASAVRRAKEAGYDGVQIHAAHGYLLSEFLSPRINKRRDAPGRGDEARPPLPEGELRRHRSILRQRQLLPDGPLPAHAGR
jgi:2,4-dienoyl-CoA reductase-like NADH-dependent reductase (Old Yellow Enzyme family)